MAMPLLKKCCLGSRSFSIFNASTKAIVYDSGDDFEMITASLMPILFNADHEDNVKKGRSRSKGPEPEGVTTAVIGGDTFAFISLERIGGVMVYNITNPNAPTFVDYKNSRSVYFNRTANVQVYDFTGKLLLSQENAQLINTSNFAAGTYFVKTDEGIVKQMIVK